MIRWAIRSFSGLALFLFFLSRAGAQVEDYRQYFKPPETAKEYWEAVKFEIELGAYKVAADYLKGFIEKAPTEKELLEIEEKEGMSAFLKLRVIPKWSEDPRVDAETKKRVEEVIQGVTNIVKAHRSDPVRIAKLVGLLSASEGERLYAISQLRRSGGEAMPGLVKELQEAEGTDKFVAIVGALPYLSRDSVPGLLAALEINDPVLRTGIVDGIRKRGDLMILTTQWDTNPVPHLYHLANSPRHPDYLRKIARSTLASILQTHPDKLPPARTELTREANRYYNHKVKFIDPRNVPLWRLEGKTLVLESATGSRAEEHYGLRFAQLALDLDPAYEPAQIAALSLVTDKAIETAGLGQPLSKSPKIKELLSTVSGDLLTATLDRALYDHRTAVALGMIRALGERMETQAARARTVGVPTLVRALNYSDRRVQFAAADTLLRLPGPPPAQAPGRIVEILRRIVQADPGTKVIIADFNRDRGLLVADAVKKCGYEPIVVQTGKELLQRLAQAADIDAILLDHELPDPPLRTLLGHLRADVDTAQLPLIVTVPPLAAGVRPADSVIPLQRMVDPYRNVTIVPATLDPDILKPMLDSRIEAAMGKPFTEEERKTTMAEAMVLLKRLAVGEIPGYSVKGAETAILKAMRSEELGALAVEAAGRLPGRGAQRELAAIVLDEAVRAEVRSLAAVELARQIQANSLALAKVQIVGLEAIFNKTEDGRLKSNVALVLGAMRPDLYKTGDRLKAFVPLAPPVEKPEPGAKEKEKEKMDKEKDKEKEKDKNP